MKTACLRAVLLLFLVGFGVQSRAQNIPIVGFTNAVWRYNDTSTSANNPGATFMSPLFDDSVPEWKSGSGLFGNDSAGVYNPPGSPFQGGVNGFTVPLDRLINGSAARVTFYFRTKFNWPHGTVGVTLSATQYLDDGAVFYLNGTEMGRFRMSVAAPTPVTWDTLGQNPPTEGVPAVLQFPGNALVTGENVLAVELHQSSAGSSDLAFGMALYGTIPYPPVILDPAEPADRNVLQNRSTTLTVRADASAPISYQWYKDNAPIPDATNTTYTIALMQAADAGDYYVRVTNPVDSINSRTAVVGYTADTVRPTLVRAIGNATFDRIVVEFDEKISASTAEDPFSYGVSGGISVSAATLNIGGSGVTLTVDTSSGPPLSPDTIYTVTVTGVADLAGNTIEPDSTVQFRSWVPSTGCGGLLFEAFFNIPGNAVSDLTSNPNYPNNPTETLKLTRFDSEELYPNSPSRENYGGRIRGLFIPPQSGNWIFYLAADDGSQLFLNPTGPNAAGKMLIQSLPGCCATYAANASQPFALTGGQAYYIEGLYKEGGGGDYLSVAARIEGSADPLVPIPGSQLGVGAIPPGVAGDATISLQPVSQTVEALNPVTFTVGAANSLGLGLCYQWQRSDNGGPFADIAGATRSSYTIAAPTVATDNGDVYRVVLGVPGFSVTSAEATLTVTADVTRPRFVRAISISTTKVAVYFSEPMPSSATDPFSYGISGGASLGDGVISPGNPTRIDFPITDPGTTLGESYTITTAAGLIVDTSGNPIDPDPASVTFIARSFGGNPDAATILPTDTMLPLGSLSERGLDVRFVQITAAIVNDTVTAERLLAGTYLDGAGQPFPNIALLPCFVETDIINYNWEASALGRLTPDKPIPGIAAPRSTDNFAMEAVAYVELRAGAYRFGVNSDDGFRVSPATSVNDPNNAITLGEFSGGRGAADTLYDIYAPQDGLYPMRLIWEEGNGGANCEWWHINYDTVPETYVGINGAGGLNAFRVAASAPPLGVTLVGTNVVLSWPSTAIGYCLQCTPTLGPVPAASWVDVGNPVVLNGATKSVRLPASAANRFYRLIRR